MRTSRAAGLLFLVMAIPSCLHGPPPFDEAEWQREVERQSVEKLYAPHFKGGKYFNPWMPREQGGFWRFLKWKLFSAKAPYTEEEKAFRPGFVPHLKDRINAMPEGDFIAWIGHASFLMRLGGEFWLTDPMFSDKAFLLKRVTPPAITAQEVRDLTPTPNILISHNHYDHLDVESIRSLPEGSRFYVPLGLKACVESLHRGPVVELDWWDTVDVSPSAKLLCLPAQHWSMRLGQGRNTTLWASYLVITPTTKVYYGADSGYFVGYKEIGRRFRGIGYALLSTTAYHPRWFMHYAHNNITEAIQAFHDLGARYFIPTQWGTFPLGDEPPGYPALDLQRTLREQNVDASRFIIMDIGQMETPRGFPPPE